MPYAHGRGLNHARPAPDGPVVVNVTPAGAAAGLLDVAVLTATGVGYAFTRAFTFDHSLEPTRRVRLVWVMRLPGRSRSTTHPNPSAV